MAMPAVRLASGQNGGMRRLACLLSGCILSACLGTAAWATPGYAVWGTFKYAPGFTHFEYVNPSAPKGGELRMVAGSRISTFDKYNPFTLKGNAPRSWSTCCSRVCSPSRWTRSASATAC
jgi:ABC-type oligopeptide transport system substrate-binding subunit